MRKLSKDQLAASKRFRQHVLAGGRCVLYGTTCMLCEGNGYRFDKAFTCVQCDGSGVHRCGGPLEAHHAIPKLALRNAVEEGYRDEALYDARNGLPLCRRSHELVSVGAMEIPVDMLPEQVFTMAQDWDVTWLLEREYKYGDFAPTEEEN